MKLTLRLLKNNVIKILNEGKNIKGVKLKNNQRSKHKNIICNADPPFVYEKLFEKKKKQIYIF